MHAALTLELSVFQSGHAYRCFCTPDHLALKREKLARSGSNSTYDKTCLHLTEEEVARKVRLGEKSVVRLNVRFHPAHNTLFIFVEKYSVRRTV
jgi:glutamyl/glutaminyl-tRNA synthetase